MPHTFVLARFNPGKSAYWLSDSGQEAASRLRTKWFWALRAAVGPGKDSTKPHLLFVVSTSPSPYPLPERTSFSLGPRKSQDSQTIVGLDAECVVQDGLLPSSDAGIYQPLYLHTIPALPINSLFRPPITKILYQLEAESFQKFATHANAILEDAHKRRVFAAKHCDPEAIRDTWAQPTRQNLGNFAFGEVPQDPHAYAFDFGEPLPEAGRLPCVEGSNAIYDEIMMYNQVCKEYRWRGIEPTLRWVRRTRELVRRNETLSSSAFTDELPDEPDLSSEASAIAMSLFTSPNPHDKPPSRSPSPSEEQIDDDTDSWFSRGSSTEYLPWQWQHPPFQYDPVSLGTVKVIAVDLSGSILDREGPIRRALTPWLSQLRSRDGSVTLDILVERYVTLEALAEHGCLISPTPESLAGFIRAALVTLAQEYDLTIEENTPLFTDAYRQILNPTLWADVEQAVQDLKRHGFTLVSLPLHSPATMQEVRAALPPWFWSNTHTWTSHVSAHSVAHKDIFDELLPYGEDLTGIKLERSEILVVSTNTCRILHAAQHKGHATALIRRPGTLEGSVKFAIGDAKLKGNPEPSIVVNGLHDLCTKLEAV